MGSDSPGSKNLHRDGGAGFCVGQGVMVVAEVVAAGGGHRLQLMVGESAAEVPSGGAQGVVEDVVGVVHLIDAEHRFEAAFVEPGVVCNEGESFYQRGDLLPHIGEHRRVLGVAGAQSVYSLAEPLVVFRLRMDERVEPLGDLPVAHHHNPH